MGVPSDLMSGTVGLHLNLTHLVVGIVILCNERGLMTSFALTDTTFVTAA